MDKLMEYDDYEMVHFNCGCLSPGHSMRITLEKTPDKHVAGCMFHFYMVGKAGIWFRLKEAWKMLKGEDVETVDFDFRLDDSKELVDFLCGLVTNPNTSHT